MRVLFVLFLLSFETVFAQGFFIPFPEPLKKYLELTDAQVSGILAKNDQLGEFRTAKLQRQLVVQLEIRQETERATIDPMAIGVRYLEIETIRREIEAESKKIVTEIQGLLTLVQKAKLGMLEEALRQQDTACAAISWNLMPQPIMVSGYANFLLFGSFSAVGQPIQAGCANPLRLWQIAPAVEFRPSEQQ